MKPFDIHLILGQDKTGQELANLNVTFQLKPQNIAKICALSQFKGAVGDDVILKFDFSTQEGRQKECIEYFESGLDKQENGIYNHNLSPLQNWFMRPKKSGKLDIYESTKSQGKEGKGQITLQYRFYKQAIESDSDIVQTTEKFNKSSFHPDLQLNVSFIGDAIIYKKNRIKIKMDYIEASLTSNEFKMKDLQNLLRLFELFGEQEAAQEIANHPLFKFVQNTEEIQLKLRMSSIRKMLNLYQIGLTQENTIKQRKKQYPQIIKGLFKQQVKVTMVYGRSIAFIAKYNYKSQAVLIRILSGLKKYMRYFE